MKLVKIVGNTQTILSNGEEVSYVKKKSFNIVFIKAHH